jgi:hypothetical protein
MKNLIQIPGTSTPEQPENTMFGDKESSLTQLIQEQKKFALSDPNPAEREFYLYGSEEWPESKYELDIEKVVDWHTSSLTAIIRNEIERKKGMIKSQDEIDDDFIADLGARANQKMGYNTAINEDIAYLEGVLSELIK